MGASQRRKGQGGEREFAKEVVGGCLGIDGARRGIGQSRGGGKEVADVVDALPSTHFEVKRQERVNIHAAMEQATNDAGARLPVVGFRRNRGEWALVIKAKDIVAFCLDLMSHVSADKHQEASDRLEAILDQESRRGPQ